MKTLKMHIEPLMIDIIYDTTYYTCKGNQSKAALLLGISRGTLRKYLKLAGNIHQHKEIHQKVLQDN